MLAFEGNTAPYMQYVRVCSVFRKAGIEADSLHGDIILTDEREALLRPVCCSLKRPSPVARDGTHVMCAYLYDLAGLFSGFYEHCPILSAEEENVRNSRLQLAALTAKTLKQGLDTLGIKTVEA